jgi:hypothetical protein
MQHVQNNRETSNTTKNTSHNNASSGLGGASNSLDAYHNNF